MRTSHRRAEDSRALPTKFREGETIGANDARCVHPKRRSRRRMACRGVAAATLSVEPSFGKDDGALAEVECEEAVSHASGVDLMSEVADALDGHQQTDDGEQSATSVGQFAREWAKPGQPLGRVLHGQGG